jgi:hypothetical protein
MTCRSRRPFKEPRAIREYCDGAAGAEQNSGVVWSICKTKHEGNTHYWDAQSRYTTSSMATFAD